MAKVKEKDILQIVGDSAFKRGSDAVDDFLDGPETYITVYTNGPSSFQIRVEWSDVDRHPAPVRIAACIYFNKRGMFERVGKALQDRFRTKVTLDEIDRGCYLTGTIEQQQAVQLDSALAKVTDTWIKMHGDEIGKAWEAPPLYIANPKKKEGHFLGFLGGRVFAVAEKTINAYSTLDNFFEQSGEKLPFVYKGQKFFVFNCTNCLSALDEKNTIYRSGRTSIKEYAFIPTRFHFSLFTVPDSHELLAVEGLSDPFDEFKGYVEENKLTGLMFEEVWKDKE